METKSEKMNAVRKSKVVAIEIVGREDKFYISISKKEAYRLLERASDQFKISVDDEMLYISRAA